LILGRGLGSRQPQYRYGTEIAAVILFSDLSVSGHLAKLSPVVG
jgi:hypothetical protein